VVRARWLVAGALAATLLGPGGAECADDNRPIDLETWHEQLGTLHQGDEAEEEPRPVFGIYPSLSAALGLPDIVSIQGHVYLSMSDGSRYGVFVGAGFEEGTPADATIVTVGWGGVRPLPMPTEQWGFYGKFLRYRRWEHRDHGVHHGLSVGAESGAGYLGLSVEVGAARSDRNHWTATAQIALKVGLPIGIDLNHRK